MLNPYHRDAIGQHLEQIKTLAPILVCAMKIYIQIVTQEDSGAEVEGKGADEAVENRNYLARRMTDEMEDVIRALEDASAGDDNAHAANYR